jgi:hypothetical protein
MVRCDLCRSNAEIVIEGAGPLCQRHHAEIAVAEALHVHNERANLAHARELLERAHAATRPVLSALVALALGLAAVACGDDELGWLGPTPPPAPSAPLPPGWAPPPASSRAPEELRLEVTPTNDVIESVHGESVTVALAVRNAGNAQARALRLELERFVPAGDGGAWTLTGDGCSGRQLEPGEACPIEVTFAARADAAPNERAHVYVRALVLGADAFSYLEGVAVPR